MRTWNPRLAKADASLRMRISCPPQPGEASVCRMVNILVSDLCWARWHAGESLTLKEIEAFQLAPQLLNDHRLALVTSLEYRLQGLRQLRTVRLDVDGIVPCERREPIPQTILIQPPPEVDIIRVRLS